MEALVCIMASPTVPLLWPGCLGFLCPCLGNCWLALSLFCNVMLECRHHFNLCSVHVSLPPRLQKLALRYEQDELQGDIEDATLPDEDALKANAGLFDDFSSAVYGESGAGAAGKTAGAKRKASEVSSRFPRATSACIFTHACAHRACATSACMFTHACAHACKRAPQANTNACTHNIALSDLL